MHVIPVTSLDAPELEPYRTLRGRTHHWQEGYCVAESEKVVRALLASSLEVHSLLMNEYWLQEFETELQRGGFSQTRVYVADDRLLERIVGFPLHQKLLAIGVLPENPPLERIHNVRAGRSVHVALEGIADAENMGMILRNCAAFGAHSLIVGPDSSSPWLRRSVRVSLGNVFSLMIHRTDDVLRTLQHCREVFDWRIIGTTPRGGAPNIETRRAGDVENMCLLFGSEANGLSNRALGACDERFSIPMRGGVDSINVANAVAVALFEATR
jgi:tRNA G18 (ribose-2'-O)-methylase SpoU